MGFISDFLIMVGAFMPLLSIWIYIAPFKGRKQFLLMEASLISLALGFLFFFHDPHWRVSHLIWFMYVSEVAILFFFLNKRFGYNRLGPSLAVTIMVVFILSEAHEWAAFVAADYLHFFVDPYTIMYGKVPTWVRIMANLQVILAFYLATRMSGLKRSWELLTLFMLSLLISVVFLPIEGLADVHILKRFLMFTEWTSIFYYFSNPEIASWILK